jgi:hypothetical protein
MIQIYLSKNIKIYEILTIIVILKININTAVLHFLPDNNIMNLFHDPFFDFYEYDENENEKRSFKNTVCLKLREDGDYYLESIDMINKFFPVSNEDFIKELYFFQLKEKYLKYIYHKNQNVSSQLKVFLDFYRDIPNCDIEQFKWKEIKKGNFCILNTLQNHFSMNKKMNKNELSKTFFDIEYDSNSDNNILTFNKSHETINIYKNKIQYLDCVVINTTNIEYNDGRLFKFLSSLNDKIASKKKRKVNLVLFFNELNYEQYLEINDKIKKLDNITSFVDNLEIVSLNLHKKIDVYNKNDVGKNYLYGFKSGPNIVFFNLIKYLIKYNTCLILEVDCMILKDNWLDYSIKYCKNNYFFISGTNYNGFNRIGSQIGDHLNGVAFYNTSHLGFQQFLIDIEIYLLQELNHNKFIAYDCAILFYMQNLKNASTTEISEFLYRYYYKMITTNNLIVNFSLESKYDYEFSVDYINTIFNPVFIHKKL